MDVETRVRRPSWRWPLLLSVVLLNVCITYILIGFKALLCSRSQTYIVLYKHKANISTKWLTYHQNNVLSICNCLSATTVTEISSKY